MEEVPITPPKSKIPKPTGGISMTRQINGLIKAMEGVSEILASSPAVISDIPQESPTIDGELSAIEKLKQGLYEAKNAYVKFE